MFKSLDKIKANGFKGFKTIQELNSNPSIIPKQKGVYIILNDKINKPDFLLVGTGGYFKRKNPNVHVEILSNNWVEETIIVYIGKAGSLQKRLKQYLDFGKGKPVGHWGGRLIWQLANSNELLICWKELDEEEPREFEKKMISDFKNQFGYRPFANLSD